MAELEVSYNNSKIIESDTSVTKTLLTAGKYCDDNIIIKYTRQDASSSYIVLKSQKGALLTCDNTSYQLTNNETEHAFLVDIGLHDVSATLNDVTQNRTVNIDTIGIFDVIINFARLPYDYQEVEYIESVGLTTQFFDTEFLVTNDWGFEIDFQITDTSSKWDGGILGIRNGSDNILWSSTVVGGGNETLVVANPRVEMDIANSDFSRKKVSFKNGKIYLNNNEISTFAWAYHPSGSIYLFTIRAGNSVDWRRWRGKLFSCKIYSDNSDETTLARDYVPCYSKIDGKSGVYDLVNNEFKTVQYGFILGADVI